MTDKKSLEENLYQIDDTSLMIKAYKAIDMAATAESPQTELKLLTYSIALTNLVIARNAGSVAKPVEPGSYTKDYRHLIKKGSTHEI